MRRDILHPGSGQLRYMIREIVQFAKEVSSAGRPIIWENIGDPVRKGEAPPEWIKDIVGGLARQDLSYAYSDTQGEPETREFLAQLANARLEKTGLASPQINAEDIIFFNGLGDAVSKIFGHMKPQARVIGPSPAYSTHSSAEAAHSGDEHLCYHLDPKRNWQPDLEDIENTIRYNPAIAGILIINPDNPTGTVYPRKTLEGFVDIARRHGLFLICDETYARVVYGTAEETSLNQVIGDVPGIAMRSISKEFPWPGARCAWIEVYNRQLDRNFSRYIDSLIAAKRLEVCSTTLPQLAIPRVMSDPRYAAHLAERNARYHARALEAESCLGGIPGIQLNRPQGGFFLTPVFDPAYFLEEGCLPIKEEAIRSGVEAKAAAAEADARFVYWLLGWSGVCVVPLSGFCSKLPGFRMTLLESDDRVRKTTLERIAEALQLYMGLGKAL